MPEAPLPAISNLPTEIETPVEKVEVIESKSIDPVPGTLDQVPGTLDPVPGTLDPVPELELEFSDEDLDKLHAEMTGESFVPAQVAFEKDSNPVKTQKTPAVKVEKSTAEISDERIPLWAMIPWSSLLGVVASLFAVAAAWFIWNQIQKPLTVEQRVARAVQSAPAAADVSASPEKKELDIEALPASHQVIYDMIQEVTSTNKNEMNFNQMPEQSRISSVELERNGLTVLDLEDQIFDEIEL
jgi:copper chaperone CopZ